MNVGEVIKQRRSIRRFKTKRVPENLIKKLLEAVRLSQSDLNSQPWRLKIIKSKEQILKLKEIDCFVYEFSYSSPLIIFFFGDLHSSRVLEKKEKVLMDLAIAGNNLALRAYELNLGTCFSNLRNEEKIKKYFKLPKDFVTPFAICIGFADENPKPRQRKKLKEILL